MKKLKNMRELRIKLNLSQFEFGKKLGVTQASVAHWEAGRSNPSIPHGHMIAKLAARIGYKINNSYFRS